MRKPLAESRFVMPVAASLIAAGLRFVFWSNRLVPGSHDVWAFADSKNPVIGVFWHGQHLMGPCVNPRGHPLVAMFSRSADARLNAMVAERLGLEIAFGSGGRGDANAVEKGGARALIALKKALEKGKNVAMIADIPHGKPREAGMGVITLARLSGRPIVPAAYASSRRIVLEKTWDKTTIHLPFGRGAIVLGRPIYVPQDADSTLCEVKRLEVTAALEAANAEAYTLVDRVR